MDHLPPGAEQVDALRVLTHLDPSWIDTLSDVEVFILPWVLGLETTPPPWAGPARQTLLCPCCGAAVHVTVTEAQP